MSFGLELSNNKDFTAALRKAPVILDRLLLDTLRQIGEDIINGSYDNREYGRITGRLQSSYAYAIIRNKRVIFFKERPDESDPDTYPDDEKHMTPRQQMEEGLNRIVSELPEKGYFLIIIAAMYYGLFVHSTGRMVMIPLENSPTYTNTKQILGNLFRMKEIGG
jgi:hypothetical protein